MKSSPDIHCRIKSFIVEKGNLLTEPNILIDMMNYAIKVILSSVYDTFNIQANVANFFTMTPCVCMKFIPLTKYIFHDVAFELGPNPAHSTLGRLCHSYRHKPM